jgi:hypothetical protein
MKSPFFHVVITSAYAPLLVAVYLLEISEKWSYMGFGKIGSAFDAVTVVLIAITIAAFIPFKFDTRSFLLAVIHYTFIVPSLVISAANSLHATYTAAILIAVVLVFIFSAFPLRALRLRRLTIRYFFIFIGALLLITVMLLAVYGGTRSFNLNIFAVYDFRRDAAATMPGIFAYGFLAISKVVAPLVLILAIYLRSVLGFLVSSVLVVLMFGMTHHKSVLFLPLFTVMFYLVLRRSLDLRLIGFAFLAIVVIAALEMFYLFHIGVSEPGIFNSIIVRRVLFVPPLVDLTYINFFAEAQKLLWSTSRLGFGLADNPYGMTGPFLIGVEAFSREDMSANTGIIGSGFSHAGYLGVVVYSTLLGLLIAFFQAFGRILGHGLVSAASVSVVMTITISSDFATVLLTHGLLLLIALLSIFPRERLIWWHLSGGNVYRPLRDEPSQP